MLLRIALRSLFHRRHSALLSLAAISLSLFLILSLQKISSSARSSFESSVSGVDLIVGARSSPLQLLLFSVFHIGNPTNNISWESFKEIESHPEVKIALPISLGDSHRGFRVVGTQSNFFEDFRYARSQKLAWKKGQSFKNRFDVVLGSDVARKLDYSLQDLLILSHGLSAESFYDHENLRFSVSGILSPTGTPVDQSLFISLEGLEAMHWDWEDGAPPVESTDQKDLEGISLKPKSISAIFVSLKTKMAAFYFQQEINQKKEEALTAILPGIAFNDLWRIVSRVEGILWVISILVIFTAFLGMLSSLLMSLNERKREVSIFRAIGFAPAKIVFLLTLEPVIICLLGWVLAVLVTQGVLIFSQDFLMQQFGILISSDGITAYDMLVLCGALILAAIAGMIPASMQTKRSLAEGLQVRV